MKQTGSVLKIFPNPAQNQLTIEQSSGNGFVSICNLGGEAVIKQTVSDLKTQIDIGLLASGMYFLNFVQDGTSEVRKFVKK